MPLEIELVFVFLVAVGAHVVLRVQMDCPYVPSVDLLVNKIIILSCCVKHVEILLDIQRNVIIPDECSLVDQRRR